MTGEIDVFGVYLPGLLVLAVVALLLTGVASRLLSLLGAYRLFAYRPLVDLAIFMLVLGSLVFATLSPETLS
ncbi:hypothetical protein BH09PSE3_BH09PSE3_19310 [soil metagenome]